MSHLLRPILAASFAALLVALPSAPSDAARRSSAYDGQWSVVIYTTYGDCDRSLRYSLQIIGGQIVSAQQNYQLAGAVAAERLDPCDGRRGRPLGERFRTARRQQRQRPMAHLHGPMRRPVDCRPAWLSNSPSRYPVCRVATLASHHGQTSRARR